MLTDLGLPGMSGVQLVKEVRKLRPDLKIVIASGYSADAAGNGELPADVSFLPKPYNDSQLKRVFDDSAG